MYTLAGFEPGSLVLLPPVLKAVLIVDQNVKPKSQELLKSLSHYKNIFLVHY
jgi:hypothetical protein